MAERRMFAKTIVLSDAFLDMPTSARCLYFTLGMLADDDGFVNQPRSIMRQCGASDDDMKLLIAKNFVLIFESGIIVVKHWRIHNYIQKDRYKPTKYQDEMNQLELKENGSYTKCIQPVSKMDTQVRLGKDSLGKVNNKALPDRYDSVTKSNESKSKSKIQSKNNYSNRIVIPAPDYIIQQENGTLPEGTKPSQELIDEIKRMQESMND